MLPNPVAQDTITLTHLLPFSMWEHRGSVNDLVPRLQKWVGARGQNRLHLPPGWCCAPLSLSLPPSVQALA